MNQMENKIIAEFMGFEKTSVEDMWGTISEETLRWDIPTAVPFDDLYFHRSWDWLMPVVEKIESLGYYVGINADCFFINYELEISKKLSIKETTISYTAKENKNSKLEMVYEGVVEFINWYNLQ